MEAQDIDFQALRDLVRAELRDLPQKTMEVQDIDFQILRDIVRSELSLEAVLEAIKIDVELSDIIEPYVGKALKELHPDLKVEADWPEIINPVIVEAAEILLETFPDLMDFSNG